MNIKCILLFFEKYYLFDSLPAFFRALKMGLSRLLGSYLGKNANCVDEREHCYGVIAWFAEFLHPQIKKKNITIQTIFQVLYHCVL